MRESLPPEIQEALDVAIADIMAWRRTEDEAMQIILADWLVLNGYLETAEILAPKPRLKIVGKD